MTIEPGLDDPWDSRIDMHWQHGRHGEEAGGFRVSSTVAVYEIVDTTECEG